MWQEVPVSMMNGRFDEAGVVEEDTRADREERTEKAKDKGAKEVVGEEGGTGSSRKAKLA